MPPDATRAAAPSVLHAIAPGPVGGAETVVLGLLAGLREAGVSVGVAVLADASSEPFLEAASRLGVGVHRLDAAGRAYWRDWRGLREAIRRHEAQVIHTHGDRADTVGLLAARSQGVPSVATAHGFTGGGWKRELTRRVHLAALGRHDAVIAVSGRLASDLAARGVARDRLEVVPNAWRPSGDALARAAARKALGLPPDAPVVGWVGRLAWVKAADVALDAFAASGVPDAILSVVGDGPDRAALEAQAARLGLGTRVRFHGMVPEAWRVLPAFDVQLLSSHSEGTPMILLEAMHAGVPIVTTAVGGIPELLDAERAWLVPPRDPAALGAALREALADRGGALRRAALAKLRLDTDYTVDAWVARHLDLYRRLVARHRT